MRKSKRRLRLDRETVRTLGEIDLTRARGGLIATTSEAEGAGPCPGEYSYLCKP